MTTLRRYFGDLWDADDATERLYFTQDLTENSVVFDVGGYHGEWSERISAKYHPHLYIFEPVQEFADKLKRAFRGNVKARVLNYGLASQDDFLPIAKCGASSSLYADNREHEEVVKFRDVCTAACEVFLVPEICQVNIDLIAINIEGGEYDLLRHMIAKGFAWRCREIMVQFHMLWPDCYDQWKVIRASLKETHEEVWCYPMVWELWRRKL